MFKANVKYHLWTWSIFTVLSIIQNNKSSPADFSHCEMQIAYKSPRGVRRHVYQTGITHAFIAMMQPQTLEALRPKNMGANLFC